MQERIDKKCPNCGGATTEICLYCHNTTGLDTKKANMEYPLIECKEAHINFWNTYFPLLFTISFGIFGFMIPIAFLIFNPKVGLGILFFCIPFTMIAVISFIISIKAITRNNLIKRNGKEIEATVYGYMDDNLLINDSPAQIVKLLVTTKEGPRFILYQSKDTKHPYKINSKIKLLVYKD